MPYTWRIYHTSMRMRNVIHSADLSHIHADAQCHTLTWRIYHTTKMHPCGCAMSYTRQINPTTNTSMRMRNVIHSADPSHIHADTQCHTLGRSTIQQTHPCGCVMPYTWRIYHTSMRIRNVIHLLGGSTIQPKCIHADAQCHTLGRSTLQQTHPCGYAMSYTRQIYHTTNTSFLIQMITTSATHPTMDSKTTHDSMNFSMTYPCNLFSHNYRATRL